jgi:hypothetical protein
MMNVSIHTRNGDSNNRAGLAPITGPTIRVDIEATERAVEVAGLDYEGRETFRRQFGQADLSCTVHLADALELPDDLRRILLLELHSAVAFFARGGHVTCDLPLALKTVATVPYANIEGIVPAEAVDSSCDFDDFDDPDEVEDDEYWHDDWDDHVDDDADDEQDFGYEPGDVPDEPSNGDEGKTA